MFAGKGVQADILNSASVGAAHIDVTQESATMTDNCAPRVSNGKVNLWCQSHHESCPLHPIKAMHSVYFNMHAQRVVICRQHPSQMQQLSTTWAAPYPLG